MSTKPGEFFLVAAEESANQYATRLISKFKEDKNLAGVRFSGVGFKNLKSKDFNVVVDADKLAVMGAFEVIQKWRNVKSAFKKSIDYIVQHKPNAVLLIDFGGFNLRLAAEIKKKSPETKVLYFISPKIWAWGGKRALKVKDYVDQMYVIHPFEVEFYKKWGVEAKFVGHPLLQELRPEFKDPAWRAEQKKLEGISGQEKVLGVMLGSRNSEINRHLGPFCEALEIIKKEHPHLNIAFILPPSKSKGFYKEKLKGLSFDHSLLQSEEPMEKIALCDLCLVASGTATLQVGMLGIPMAIAYMMNPITMYLARKFVKGVKYAGLVNIIKDREISKEFLQNDLRPLEVASYLNRLLNDPSFYKETQNDLLTLVEELGSENTYERLKNELVRYL